MILSIIHEGEYKYNFIMQLLILNTVYSYSQKKKELTSLEDILFDKCQYSKNIEWKNSFLTSVEFM